MIHRMRKLVILAAAAISVWAISPAAVYAQNHTEDHHDDHPAMHDDHKGDDHRGDDPADRYRHDHPHASARCHDGFFTTTRDRGRACRKHGGIDVWLIV